MAKARARLSLACGEPLRRFPSNGEQWIWVDRLAALAVKQGRVVGPVRTVLHTATLFLGSNGQEIQTSFV